MAETAVIPPNNHVIPSSPVSHRHVKPAKPKSIGLYKLGRTLGEGTYGKVKLGTHMYTGQEVAIKIMRPHETNNRQEVEREIAVLKLLKHPNIVQLFEVIEEESSGRIFLVLELVAGGELFDYIVARGRVKEKEARKFFRQIISGVEYCHANLVVHRDLKPENLLLDADGNVKINDFGFSNLISPGKLFSTFCGSPIYAPPEIILEKEYLGPGVDIWSMGVILYALVNGQLPWRLGKNGRIIDIEKLLAGQFECSPSSNLSKSVKDLMSRMIVADPKNRASLAEVRNHPWISEGYDSPPPCMLAARPPVTQVKEDVLNQLVLIGFDREGARTAILTNEISPAVTTYHLLLEKAGYTVPSAAAPPVPSVTPVITQELAASPSPPSPSVGARPPTSPDPRRPTSPSRRLSMDLRVRPPIIGPGVLTPISEDGSDSHKTAAPVSPSAVPASPVAPAPIVTRRGRAHTITSVMVPSGLGIHAASGPAVAAPVVERPGLANIAIPPHITHTDGTHSAPGSPQTKTRRNSILSIFKKSPAVEKPSMVVPVAAAPLTPTAAAAIAAAAAAATNAALPQTPPGPPGSAPKRRLSLQALPVPWSPSKAPVKEKLREIKGVFNVDTTTLKPADQIVAEVVRVLEDSAIEFKQKGYIFKCKQKQPIDKTERVQFDLEICQIQGLNMNGVRFKRISGGVWGYRTLCQALMQKMKL